MKGAEQYILFWGFEGGGKFEFLDSALIIWCFSRKIEESLGRAFPLWQVPSLYNLSVIADAMPPLLVGEALAVPAK